MMIEYLAEMIALMIDKACTRSISLDTFILKAAEADKVGQKSRNVRHVVEAEFGRAVESLYGDIGGTISVDC